MIKWKRDVALGIFLLLFSLSMYFYTGATIGTNTISLRLAQPDLYLQMWLIILGTLSIFLIFKAIRKKEETFLPKIWGKPQVITVLSMVIYLLSMKWIGFSLSTAIFMSFIVIFYSYYANKIKIEKKDRIIQLVFYVAFSVVTTFLLQYLFSEVLGVLLPRFKLF